MGNRYIRITVILNGCRVITIDILAVQVKIFHCGLITVKIQLWHQLRLIFTATIEFIFKVWLEIQMFFLKI